MTKPQPPLNTAKKALIERAIDLLRQHQLLVHGTHAAAGLIPMAQVSILADMDANKLKALLYSGDETSVDIGLRILRPFIESAEQEA